MSGLVRIYYPEHLLKLLLRWEAIGVNRSVWKIGGFLFTSALGTFLHFLFDLSGQSVVASLFSAVNESIWEHMKLIYFPMLLFGLIEYFLRGRDEAGFWCKKLAGMALGLTLIPVLYYTYTGILGTSADWFNVTIFFLAAAAAYWLENRLYMNDRTCRIPSPVALGLICLVVWPLCYLHSTHPIFPSSRTPSQGGYGI